MMATHRPKGQSSGIILGDKDPKKRKATTEKIRDTASQKRTRSENPTLLGPHETIIAELSSKYDILAVSVISSTQIQKRVVYTTNHLREGSSHPVVLLHARPAETSKLITVVEQCKRVLKAEGKSCFQYNQLFDLPENAGNLGSVGKNRTRDGAANNNSENDEDDDDDFEVMETRFETALRPLPSTQVAKSLRIFLSAEPVPELKIKDNVTVQSTSNESKS